MHIAQEFLRQTRERVRSLQGVNEELALRSLVQKAPEKCVLSIQFEVLTQIHTPYLLVICEVLGTTRLQNLTLKE